jgi:NAD+ kinase
LKKLAEQIQRVGIIANSEKVSSRKLVRQAASLIRASHRAVLVDAATARLSGLNVPTAATTAALARQVDLLMVFGGDGTMLRATQETAGSRTPIIGINVGALGFLTDVQAHQLPLALKQIWAGESVVESRPLIQATGTASGDRIQEIALNDFVISRGAAPRLIELEVTVDDDVLTRYRCDGLIVCSPTGSTAYSLSAGGAIVSPAADVLALTPICPHTLSNRSVIVSLDSTVQVRVFSERVEAVLTADGQKLVRLSFGDVVAIQRSRHSVRLLHLAGSSFFETLRRKLNWSGSNV